MAEKKNAMVAVYKTHIEAEAGIKELQKAGFPMKKLSIVGKEYHSDEHVVGYYNTGDRVRHWGKLGAFWGGIWGLLFGSAFFMIPGFGSILVAGPLVAMLVGALEGSVVVGGLSALGAGLYSIGIPKDSVVRYETAIKAGKYIIVAHGTAGEVLMPRKSSKTQKPLNPKCITQGLLKFSIASHLRRMRNGRNYEQLGLMRRIHPIWRLSSRTVCDAIVRIQFGEYLRSRYDLVGRKDQWLIQGKCCL